jgi:hypothetical protein
MMLFPDQMGIVRSSLFQSERIHCELAPGTADTVLDWHCNAGDGALAAVLHKRPHGRSEALISLKTCASTSLREKPLIK